MDKTVAQNSIKNVYGEIFSLTPSALITLFEIDVGELGFSRNLISSSEVSMEYNTIFRFHNNINMTSTSLLWGGKEYVAAPINAEGFEITAKGTLPTPKLSLSVSDEGVGQLAILKDRINQLGDIIGAKVTRIRTFAKFIDKENFFNQKSPQGFAPDSNAELPRDIFFIDRKSLENKTTLEFELASALDIEGIKLPGRLVISNTCPFTYRGAGCLYEYQERRTESEHGNSGESLLPREAPPVATEFDESIQALFSGSSIMDRGEYNSNLTYNSGETVYVQHSNIKYYFVANGVDIETAPPNLNYWVADQCSKKVLGCQYRYGLGGSVGGNSHSKGVIPFGGFPAVNRFK